MMTVLGLVMVLFPHALIGLFAEDPLVANTGANVMRIAGAFQPLLALNFIMSGGLRGAGDTRWPLYTKIVSTWGVRLPLVTLLVSLGFGLTGAWIAIASDFLIQGLLAWWRFRKGAWQTVQV
jgi:Na+-driven multidrug efflux pump